MNVTYVPSFSTWDLQGYKYEKGLVWVTKDKKEIPSLLYIIPDSHKELHSFQRKCIAGNIFKYEVSSVVFDNHHFCRSGC